MSITGNIAEIEALVAEDEYEQLEFLLEQLETETGLESLESILQSVEIDGASDEIRALVENKIESTSDSIELSFAQEEIQTILDNAPSSDLDVQSDKFDELVANLVQSINALYTTKDPLFTQTVIQSVALPDDLGGNKRTVLEGILENAACSDKFAVYPTGAGQEQGGTSLSA